MSLELLPEGPPFWCAIIETAPFDRALAVHATRYLHLLHLGETSFFVHVDADNVHRQDMEKKAKKTRDH